MDRKYAFSWDVVGVDFDDARPSLGPTTSLASYRLLQFTMRDVLEQRLGTQAADELFRDAGALAGREFFAHFCSSAKDVPELAKIVQKQFRTLGIGIVRFEQVDLDKNIIQLTVDEDLDCSGLPDNQDQICVYDEGFIQGIFEAFTGKKFMVREVDCWCSGERTCRFRAEVK